SGEEHLYSDFPEIDLSQLDAGDLDSAGCFSELQWGGEHSETDSSQYSTDDSELFQIIDSENEALLAALTETLDDIQGDDMGLAAFRTMEEGDTLNPATTSPAPSPKPTAPVTGGPPPAPECDELSLLKKLLLSPSPPSCEAQRDGSARRPGTPKSRPPRPCTKVEGPRDRRASVPQAQSRSCTELHRHLTSSTSCSQTKAPQAPEECPGSGHHPSPGGCAHHEDDSDSSEDSLSSGDSVAALSSAEDGTGSQFSCEGELHSVVELIRYMHTYCLPPRKLPARDPADSRPQPCSDSAVHAVRRSKRLNPELGHWLSFLEEPHAEPSVPLGCREAAPCPVLEGFSTEEPAAEVEVGGTAPSAEPQPLCLGSLGDGEVATESRRCALLEQTGVGVATSQQGPVCPIPPETPRCLTLSLAQTELCLQGTGRQAGGGRADSCPLSGGPGLTPPTTPPYKPAEEDLYKPDIPQEAGKEEGMAPSPGGAGDAAASRKAPRKHPERTELFAHLSRARPLPEQQGLLKRPFSRSFGDHDYCQVLKPEPALQRKVLKSWEPPSQVETEHKRRVPAAHYQGLELGKDTGTEMLWKDKDGVKQLRDQEIRASLTKHFGFLDSALDDEDMVFCKTPEYDTVFEDSCSESGSPVEEDEEEEEEEEEEHGGTKLCLRRSALSRTSLHYCSRSRSSSGSSCCRSRSPASRRTFRCENGEQCQGGSGQRGQLKKRREKAIGEGRVVYIRNLSSSMSSSELKKRFEVFGEIVECQVLTRTNRGEKYGFITYRYSEHAALSLKNGPSLRKRNEPSFQLSSGGLGRFFWTRYADLDCSTDESSPAPVKSKYETMDFDSLLQEAQLSLH
ncbi:PRGC2 protein, partial [Vidua macroura]|nr:PRGC2 protein [Vidua macroura]